jgi:hypothetical protein
VQRAERWRSRDGSTLFQLAKVAGVGFLRWRHGTDGHGIAGARRPAGPRLRGAPAAEPPSAPDILPPHVAAVLQELSAAGRLNTAAGQFALRLALELDSPMNNGSQQAALVRQALASLNAALAGAPPPADELDELERRRREKAAMA